MKRTHPLTHLAKSSGLNTLWRGLIQIVGGKNRGGSLKGAKSRTEARRESNRSSGKGTKMKTEEVAANAIGTGNVATFDPLLATKLLDPRLQRMINSLDGPDTPAKKAVKQRIIASWYRMHGPRSLGTDQAQTDMEDM